MPSNNIAHFNEALQTFLSNLERENSRFIADALSSPSKVKTLKALVLNPMTSRQIIEATGVSRSSVSTVIRYLVLMGVVESVGTVDNCIMGRGQRANLWALTGWTHR